MARRPGQLIRAGGGLPTVLLLFGWASPAAAQPAARFGLSWNAPAGCPNAADIQARVGALLGDGAGAGTFADVRASGQVERGDNGFRLMLSMGVGGNASSRVIEARTCDELAGAAAVAIALLARSAFEDAAPAPSTDDTAPTVAPPAPPAPPPSPEPERPIKTPPAAASPSRWHVVFDVPTGVVGWGALPSTSLGLGAGAGLRWEGLRITAGGELWQPQMHTVSGYSSRFKLQSGRAQACLLQSLRGVELGPCLGAALQRLSAEGQGSESFARAARASTWISGLGGIFVSLPTPGFKYLRLFGAASVLVSPVRPRFVIDQLGVVHHPALAAPRLDLGCEWIF